MAASFDDIMATARSSWRLNYPRSDGRLRQKQLHGLHKLLIVGRQELLELLQENYNTAPFTCEVDLAAVIQDIAIHLELLNAKEAKPVSKPSDVQSKAELIPSGVVLIVTAAAATSTIKSIFGPITAALAAGNVVVVGSRTPSHPLLDYLQRQSGKFLNPDLFFVLNGIDINNKLLGLVDKLVIIDDERTPYDGLLDSPKTRHYSPNEGLNLAIVGEGKKDWTAIVSQTRLAMSTNTAASESLHGIFVRKEDEDAFLPKFIPGTLVKPFMNGSTRSRKVSLLDATYLNSTTFKVELKDVLTAAVEAGGQGIGKYLSEAKGQHLSLVVLYTSIDQVIDALRKMDQQIKCLGFMAPVSANAAKYLNDFLPSGVFCVDNVLCGIPAAVQTVVPSTLTTTSMTLYPKSFFSNVRIVVASSNTTRKGDLTISQIRAQYEKLIEPLSPDDRGQRLSFFHHVLYAFIGAGSILTIGVSLGAYYGWKALRK